jgi:hypothetical protein
MAEESDVMPATSVRAESAVDELDAAHRELFQAVVRQIEFSVAQMKETPDDARERFRTWVANDPDDVASDQVSWFWLSSLGEASPERARALWQRLRAEADRDLGSGTRMARTLERPLNSRPQERAAFLAIQASLKRALEPRNALDVLLMQQMASAFEMQMRWQEILVRRMEEEVWQGDRDRRRELANMSPARRERYESENGWLPPRLAETEALEQAAMLSDRYQRSFLRLLKAYRDNRRVFNALIVAGGQVNIGEQQINVADNASKPPNRDPATPSRRKTPPEVKRRTKIA